MDMGGYGRALECLTEVLCGGCMNNLLAKYPDSVKCLAGNGSDPELLRAAQSNRLISSGKLVGNIDPRKVELLRMTYRNKKGPSTY